MCTTKPPNSARADSQRSMSQQAGQHMKSSARQSVLICVKSSKGNRATGHINECDGIKTRGDTTLNVRASSQSSFNVGKVQQHDAQYVMQN